jgi:hypothetical protein
MKILPKFEDEHLSENFTKVVKICKIDPRIKMALFKMKFSKAKSKYVKSHCMTLATFVGVSAGILLGFLLRLRIQPWTPQEVITQSFGKSS